MTKVLICVDGKSYKEIGERKFDAAMNGVGIILKKGPESLQEYSEVYFRAYGMDAFVIEGSVPDDVDVDALRRNLQDFLGEGMKPIIIILMYIDKEEEIDKMISFMMGMDIDAMQDAVQRGVRKTLAGHPRTSDVSLFVEEHPEMCTYIIRYAAAAMGGEMYRTMMQWLMEEKERSEESE